MNTRGGDNTEIKKIPPISDANFDIDTQTGFQEAKLISSGLSIKELEANEKARIKQINRKDRFKGHFECAVLVVLWVAVTGGVVIAIIWLCQFILPERWWWLTPDAQERLNTLFLGSVWGVVSTIGSKILKNRISEQ